MPVRPSSRCHGSISSSVCRFWSRYRITYANVVPPIVLALAKSPLVDKYDLHHLHTIFSGAAPLGEQIAAAASARLGCRVVSRLRTDRNIPCDSRYAS